MLFNRLRRLFRRKKKRGFTVSELRVIRRLERDRVFRWMLDDMIREAERDEYESR